MNRAEYIDVPEPTREEEDRLVDAILDKHQARQRKGRSHTRAVAGSALAAALAAALVLWLVRPTEPAPMRSGEVAQTRAQGSTLRLVDGSEILVEAFSKLRLDEQSESLLRVELQRGSAVFDVARRPERSFLVVTELLTVRVVGTRFRVASKETETGAEVSVAVERGEVEVHSKSGSMRRLRAGQRYDEATPVAAVPVPDEPEPSDLALPREESTTSTRPPERGRGVVFPRLFERANAARSRGDFDEAIRLYERFIAREPNHPAAKLAALEVGRLRLDNDKDAARAAQTLEHSLRGKPGPVYEDSLGRLVEAYDKSGDRKRCQAARDRYLREFPQGLHQRRVKASCKAH